MSWRARTLLGLRVEAAAGRIDDLRKHILPPEPGQSPAARAVHVAAACDVLAIAVGELRMCAMEIYGPYSARVSSLGRAAAGKAAVA